jgi:hypothetical protein
MAKIHASLRVFLWSFAFVAVLLCSLRINQVDLWWQLPEGIQLWKTFTLPTAPVSAYGWPAASYIDEYAGYEMVLALVYKIGGFTGLWLVFSWIFLAIIFVPLVSGRKKFSSFDLPSTAALLLAGVLMWQRMEERPAMVGSLLLVILMALLRHASLERMPWSLPGAIALVFVVWTNTHSTFVVGLFTLLLWTACEIARKDMAGLRGVLLLNGLVLAAAAVFACLLNPYGPKRIFFPFSQTADPGSTALSMEMWPIRFLPQNLQIVVWAAAILLFWALLVCRGRPLWLTLFSLVAIYLSVKHFRFVDLLVIALLFSFSFRDERSAASLRDLAPSLKALRWIETPLLAVLCMFLLLLESLDVRSLKDQMASQKRFATETTFFSPEIVDQQDGHASEPVLCGHGEGAYLSFDPGRRYQPMLDSGLGHFSDSAKRYFFFLWHEPRALDYALDHLPVKAAILNRGQTIRWALVLERKAGWNLAACTTTGQLWTKGAPPSAKMSPSLRLQVEKSRDGLVQEGKFFDAFCCSTLLGQPGEGLRIISHNQGEDWSAADYNFLDDWIDAQPAGVIKAFLTRDGGGFSPLVKAILEERLQPGKAAQALAGDPAARESQYGKLLRAQDALARGDRDEARKILDTLPTHPPASAIYYTLKGLANPSGLDAYGRWEAWDGQARDFFATATLQLTARIAYLTSAAPSRRPESASSWDSQDASSATVGPKTVHSPNL